MTLGGRKVDGPFYGLWEVVGFELVLSPNHDDRNFVTSCAEVSSG